MTIRNFETLINPIILERGLDYFENGQVRDLDEHEDLNFTLCVKGSQTYRVVIELDEQENILYSNCNCPYDQGPVCKHQVASYYALQDYLDHGERNPNPTTSLASILDALTKEQLIQFLLPILKSDYTLEKQLRLQHSTTDDRNTLPYLKELFHDIINNYISSDGYVDYHEEDAFADELWQLFSCVYPLHQQEDQIVYALSALLVLLEESMDAMNDYEDNNDIIDQFTEEAVAQIQGFLEESYKYGEQTKTAILNMVCQKIPAPPFCHWNHYAAKLLKSLVPYGQNTTLNQLLVKTIETQLETTEPCPYATNREDLSFMLFELFSFQATREEIGQHLEKNHHEEPFRNAFFAYLMEEKQYERALNIAKEGAAAQQSATYKTKHWKKQQYQAYRALGDIKNIDALGKELLFFGDIGYFNDLKAIHIDDFPIFYEQLKQAFKANAATDFNHTFRSILVQEKDTEELFHLVQRRPSFIKSYMDILYPAYGEKALALYRKSIEENASNAYGRDAYRVVCREIKEYKEWEPNSQVVSALIQALKQAYKRKPAFQEELNKIT